MNNTKFCDKHQMLGDLLNVSECHEGETINDTQRQAFKQFIQNMNINTLANIVATRTHNLYNITLKCCPSLSYIKP